MTFLKVETLDGSIENSIGMDRFGLTIVNFHLMAARGQFTREQNQSGFGSADAFRFEVRVQKSRQSRGQKGDAHSG